MGKTEKIKNIVLIDPITQTIKKTYVSKSEAILDLNIKKSASSVQACLNHRSNTCENFLLKYEDDATPENIKIWSEKVPVSKTQKVVVINPVTERIHKIYESKIEACTDLNIKYADQIYTCLNDIANSYYNYILKYYDDAMNLENIKIWSEKAITYPITKERKSVQCVKIGS